MDILPVTDTIYKKQQHSRSVLYDVPFFTGLILFYQQHTEIEPRSHLGAGEVDAGINILYKDGFSAQYL